MIFEKFGCGKFAQPLANACAHWGISNDDDICRLLGQLSVESVKFTRTVENLNYSAARLIVVFPGRNGMRTVADAQAVVDGGQASIGNAIYGGSWGAEHLGNTQPGDGFKFRGRGLIQITGRDNYHAASYGMYGDDRLLTNPDPLAIDPAVAANAACWFWYAHHLSVTTDITELTRKINGGTNGLAQRIAETNRARGLL